MPRKVLVTGAGGFAGSNLCRHLQERGDTVRAMVRPGGNTNALDGFDIDIVHGDIAFEDGVPETIFKGIDIVYHIAALFRQEGANRDVFLNINATGTERMLRAAMKAGVPRFMHCSTAGVHGHIRNPPANETAPFRPGDWYQETKLEGEKIALAYGKEHHFPVSVVRPSAIYGPGDMRFLKLFRPIGKGCFVMIGNGKPLYHFVHVHDLARGFVLAAETDAAIGESFIIAGPEYISIQQMVVMIARELDKPVPRLRIPLWPLLTAAHLCKAVCQPLRIKPPLYPRRLDFFRNYRAFDCTKAKEVLGYEPRIGVQEGISQMAAWYREQNLV